MLDVLFKTIATGIFTATVFVLSYFIAPVVLPFLIIPGMIPATIIMALTGGYFEEWTAAEGLDGPVVFSAMVAMLGFLTWWLLGLVAWLTIDRAKGQKQEPPGTPLG